MTNKHTKSVEEEVRRIKSSLLILAYAIEEGRIDGIVEEITQSFQYAETSTPTPSKGAEELPEFGDTTIIEQKRYGVDNEQYTHKVIGTSRSNAWVDVPVQTPREEVLHDEVVDVVSCICEGVMETEVRKYRVEDVKIVKNQTLTQLQKDADARTKELEDEIQGMHWDAAGEDI
jgi:hypothetical protein